MREGVGPGWPVAGPCLLYSSRRKPSHQTMSGRDTDFRTHCSVTRRRDARSILMERERSESSCFMVLAGRHTHTSTGVDTCAADAGATPNAPAVAATRIGGTWLACVDSIYLSILPRALHGMLRGKDKHWCRRLVTVFLMSISAVISDAA